MTVRVNKGSFNIREKLTELGRRFGLKGSEIMAAETIQEARDLVSAGRKNIIMNGDMQVSQRGTTFANATSYTLDRWHFGDNTGGQITVTQESSGGPPGFANFIQGNVDVVDSSVTGTDYTLCSTIIEGYDMRPLCWGTDYAKYAVLSFWHKHSIVGKYSVSLRDTNANYNYLVDYTQNVADVWQKSIIVIPPPPGGTWNSTNGMGLRLAFAMSNGATYQSSTEETWFSGQYYHSTPYQIQMLGTLNAKFRLTGIQLEVGKNATDFEYRSYGEELALCERYFQKYGYGSLMWASPRSPQNTYTEYTYGSFRFRTAMRDTASIGVIGSNFAGIRYNGSGYVSRAIALTVNSGVGQVATEYSGAESCTVRIIWSTDWTANDLVNVVVTNADSALTFNADF